VVIAVDPDPGAGIVESQQALELLIDRGFERY
jgi:hypothetical protein